MKGIVLIISLFLSYAFSGTGAMHAISEGILHETVISSTDKNTSEKKVDFNCLYKGGYKKDGQGIVLQKKSEDLCKACKPSVVDFLNGKDVTPQIKKGNEGGSVRLDVYYNAAAGIAYAQLFDFRNYAYEPETDVIEIHSPRADKLISQL